MKHRQLITQKLQVCPQRGGKLKNRYHALYDRLESVNGSFDIEECKSCGIGITNPLAIDNLGVLYPKNYFFANKKDNNYVANTPEQWCRRDQYKFDFSLVFNILNKTWTDIDSYLDIGCGIGERLYYAKSNGVKRICGIDKFDKNVVPKDSNAEFINDDICSVRLSKKYSYVSLFNVLEHFPNVDQTLLHIRKNLLSKDGYLIIQVPNYDSIERYIFGPKWYCFDVPRHLWHFNYHSLNRILAKNGFRILGSKFKNAPLHPISIAPSINIDLDIGRLWNNSGKMTQREMVLRKLIWVGSTALTIPLNIIQSLFNKSSMLTIVARARFQ